MKILSSFTQKETFWEKSQCFLSIPQKFNVVWFLRESKWCQNDHLCCSQQSVNFTSTHRIIIPHRKHLTSLTVPNFKVFEGEFRPGVVEQHLAVEREHHGAFVHVHHTSHHVSGLPGATEVLVALMPALSLQEHTSLVTTFTGYIAVIDYMT